MSGNAQEPRTPRDGERRSDAARLQDAERASGRRLVRGVGILVLSLLAFVVVLWILSALNGEESAAVHRSFAVPLCVTMSCSWTVVAGYGERPLAHRVPGHGPATEPAMPGQTRRAAASNYGVATP